MKFVNTKIDFQYRNINYTYFSQIRNHTVTVTVNPKQKLISPANIKKPFENHRHRQTDDTPLRSQVIDPAFCSDPAPLAD